MPAAGKSAASANPTTPRELTIIRSFNAARELVHARFTEPEHVMRWSGLRMFVMRNFTKDAAAK